VACAVRAAPTSTFAIPAISKSNFQFAGMKRREIAGGPAFLPQTPGRKKGSGLRQAKCPWSPPFAGVFLLWEGSKIIDPANPASNA
jgi:hypothetical protein